MAFIKNHKLTHQEEEIGLKTLNKKKPLPDDVKRRLTKLNTQTDTILKVKPCKQT